MSKSLFYEYAITPDVFDADYIASDRGLQIILVELLKSICENGMIADLNGRKWRTTVDEQLSILSPSLRDKILACLKKLSDRNRLVYHSENLNFDPVSDTTWLNIASTITFLDGIIASQRVIESLERQNPHFINALDALDSNVWMKRRRTLTLKTSNAYYRPVLEPILRHASSLTIVDPYFSPHKPRFTNFLKLCLEHMGKRYGGNDLPGRINIHAGDPSKEKSKDGTPPDTIGQRKDAWKRELIRMTRNSPHEFRVYLRKQIDNGARFHDRYIITDQCCIAIPLGTDTDSDETSTTTTWCLLDHEDMTLKHEEISPERKTFKVLGGVIKYKNGKTGNISEML